MTKPAKAPKKKIWDTHVYLNDAERRALEAIARREARSLTRQISVYIRRGLAADAQ